MDWPVTEPGLSLFKTSNEPPVLHALPHTNRVGHEMFAKPGMLALQPHDTTEVSHDGWGASGSSIMVCPFSLCFPDSNKSAKRFEKK
jgi:hypothetical protein